MRLWHIDLIDVLPRQQLLAQWRELNSIFKKQDNHILINFVYDYSKWNLLFYTDRIIEEFDKRGYRINKIENYAEYFKSINILEYSKIKEKGFKIYPKKMDDIYLRECLYNLEEKAICGGITKKEWNKIYVKYKDKFDLWNGE